MNAFRGLSATAQGILLMIVTVTLFTIMDATAKGLASRYDTFQVVWARYTSQTLVAVVILAPRLKRVLKTRYLPLQLVRSAFLFLATISFFFGIVLVGLAETSAVMSINPMLITLAAFFILGENLGPRRIFGVVAGLAGALIIIRPGATIFEPASLLGVSAAAFYAGYAISTRFLGREESVWTSFLYTALIGTLVASAAVPLFWTTPTLEDAGIMLLLGIIGGAGQLSLIKALSLAEASAIAPLAYLGPVLATIWGYLFFDEIPDLWALVGAIVIIGAGIYVWHRENAVTRAGSQA